MAPAARNIKPIFKTSSPLSETKWPDISPNDQEIILDLVCNLIAPLGDHRKTFIRPSRGRKRKRKSKDIKDATAPDEAPPPPPEIGTHVLVGINSVTRHLESLAAQNAPKSVSVAEQDEANNVNALSMIIVTHPKPSVSPVHAHIPTLVHISTLQPPSPSSHSQSAPTPRLISLASSSDARLASALHIPRVGALALFANAPGAKALEAFATEKVDVTACKWIDEAMAAEWKGLNVKTEIASAKPKNMKPGKEKSGLEHRAKKMNTAPNESQGEGASK